MSSVSQSAARGRARDALVRGRHRVAGGAARRLSAPVLRRHAPACRDRDRAAAPAALLIADEPTTALDVTIQAQILAEVQALCRRAGTALIWITHDLAVVAGLADRIAVMYAGRIVEQGPVDAVLDAPLHPYTRGLIGSVPSRAQRGAPLTQIPGMPPSLARPAARLRVRAALRARRRGLRRRCPPCAELRRAARGALLASAPRRRAQRA